MWELWMAGIFNGFCAHYFMILAVVAGASKGGSKKYTKELRDS